MSVLLNLTCWLALICSTVTGSGYDCGSYTECGGETDAISPAWYTSPYFLGLAGLGSTGLIICTGVFARRWWRGRPGRELPYPDAEPAGSGLSEVLQPSY
jgi:hypothetical protein